MKKTHKNTTDMMWSFLKGSKRYFLVSILCGGMASLLDLVNPQIIAYVVDHVLGQAERRTIFDRFLTHHVHFTSVKQALLFFGILVIVIAFIDGIFRYLNRLMNAKAAEHLVMTMRNALFEHMLDLPFSWFHENATGDIIQRCTSDVESVKKFLSEQLTSVLRIVILLVLSLIFMWQINVTMTWIAAISIPVIALYSILFGRKIGMTFLKADEEEGTLSAFAQENIAGVRVVRAFGREAMQRDGFAKQNDIYTKAYLKLNIVITLFWTIGDFISNFQVMIIVLIGAYFCVKGTLTPGHYIAFVSYNAMLSWPVRQLGRVVGDMSKAGVSIERIFYIMHSPIEEETGSLTPSFDADITFDHVRFGYNDEDILSDIHFVIERGTTFGILGSTASGKSTLMYLLDRFYDLKDGQGAIYIGDTDIRDIKRSYLRRQIGFVLQEPYLFSRTIAENISISSRSLAEDQLEDVTRKAQLSETIRHFHQGFDTPVGERGVTLSGGQKQRLAIAQMLVKEPPIMIFDDSLSAVDGVTDAKIRQEVIEASPATKIVISHRITTLSKASKIAVMHQGRVVELGSHEELIKQNGLYKRIYDIQMAGRSD